VETVISGIVVAAVSGLGFLAYKHSRAYKKLYWPLSIISLALFLGAIVWDKSNSTAHVTALPYIPREMLAEADKAITDKTFFGGPKHPVYIGIGMCLIFYLTFLYYLPLLFDDNKPVKEEHDKQ
jgi:hypothetical protein